MRRRSVGRLFLLRLLLLQLLQHDLHVLAALLIGVGDRFGAARPGARLRQSRYPLLRLFAAAAGEREHRAAQRRRAKRADQEIEDDAAHGLTPGRVERFGKLAVEAEIARAVPEGGARDAGADMAPRMRPSRPRR